MRFLILGDIHANLSALQAIAQASAGTYDRIVCLGDLAGYGADPNEVVLWIREHAETVVRGNHDRACSGSDIIEWFQEDAQIAALWTFATLTRENLDYLQQLPPGPAAVANFWAVHGSPADEDEYIAERADAAAAFRSMPGELCFFAHTHHQVGYGHRGGKTWTLAPVGPGEERRIHQLEPDASYLLNPGSAGQPRDRDPRAAYAIYDCASRILAFHRVPYDFRPAQERIRAAGLPAWLGERLALGR